MSIDIPAELIWQGADKILVDPDIRLYEKTTDDIEEVAGRVGEIGSDNYHAVLFAGGTQIGWFLKQWHHLPLVSGKPSSDHAENDEDIDFAAGGDFGIKAVLAASQTITKGMELEAESGTGNLVAKTTGTTVAIAAEDKTTTIDLGIIKVWNKINS